MDTSSTHVVEETNYMRSGEEDKEEDEGGDEEDGEADGDEEDKKEEKVELAVQKQQSSPWAPWFFCRATKEVHYYVGQEIVITEGLDSYAGMIWPGALALCHYLDTHREQLSLVDKAVLEIGAGTGLVSIVAAFLGGWVTATDLPVVLNNLRVNLSRNTRGLCRHTPQVAALTWGYDLESTYPTSVYRYDYVMAADVVYHHDFLEELLFTMKHFCKPGTTLIWANKVRFESDLTFMENFKKAFHTNLLLEDGEMKIFMATCREEEGEGDVGLEDLLREEEEGKTEEAEAEDEDGDVDEDDDDNDDDGEKSKETLVEEQFVDEGKIKGNKNDNDVTGEPHMSEPERGDDKEETNKHESDEEMEEVMVLKDDDCKEDEKDKPDDSSSSTTPSKAEVTGQAYINQPAMPQGRTPGCISMSIGKDIYHYVGQDIVIHESIDSYGAVMWPGAVALCSFLDNNREMVNLQEKEVLELGAGTGLVTIVASLLGASVTATDLPEVLGNLRANVTRNTRGRCRHTPQVGTLTWGYDLESTYPASVHHYDYVLAADVVYHHDFLEELLFTMKHFCKPGTTVIWANKVRFESDLTFTENFKKAFHTNLLLEDEAMKIFMATSRE